MNFSDLIKKINSDKKLIPDFSKSEKGNNFRAISESVILDVINPILNEAEVFYTIEVKNQQLDIKEAWGSKGKKLQFIATVTLKVTFFSDENEELLCSTESVGMGIDDNDKAMGKAYTYALKYALLKLFRLQYGDDPDAKASEPLYADKPKEVKNNSDSNAHEKKSHENKNTSGEKLMTENQRDYILGMMNQKKVSAGVIISKFDRDPSFDENIPMKVARAMIKFLEEYTPAQDDDLPF